MKVSLGQNRTACFFDGTGENASRPSRVCSLQMCRTKVLSEPREAGEILLHVSRFTKSLITVTSYHGQIAKLHVKPILHSSIRLLHLRFRPMK